MSGPEVNGYVERVATELRNHGRTDRADGLLRELRTPARTKPAVFVAGEDKRGKSCLVNALLGRPDLSPVGVEVVTGAPMTFFAADPPTAMVFRYGEPRPTTTTADEARSLATVAGNPGNTHNIRAVALGIASPLLDRINLVDTPGVGGLDSGHGALTLQSLNSADAMIFVAEAAAPLRSAEVDFLRDAASRIDTVILVLTKCDRHRGWRRVLEDNARILEEHAPRFAECPVVAVSSLLALRGLKSGDPDEAGELRRESGINELAHAIDEHVVQRSARLRERNLVRIAAAELMGIDRGLREQLAALSSTAGSREALRAEQVRLEALRQSRAEWAQALDIEIRRLSLERSERATRSTLEIKRRYEDRVRHLRQEEIDTLPGELVADLAALASALNEYTVARLSTVVEQQLEDIDAASRLRDSFVELTEGSLRADLESFALGDHDLATADKFTVLSSFSSGRSLGMLAGALASTLLAAPVGLAVGFGVGGLFAFQSFRTRNNQAFAVAFQSWMAAQIAQTLGAVNTTFSRRMIDFQPEVRAVISDVIGRREAQITEALSATEALVHAEEAQRTQAEQRLRAGLESVQSLRQRGSALLAEPDSERAVGVGR